MTSCIGASARWPPASPRSATPSPHSPPPTTAVRENTTTLRGVKTATPIAGRAVPEVKPTGRSGGAGNAIADLLKQFSGGKLSGSLSKLLGGGLGRAAGAGGLVGLAVGAAVLGPIMAAKAQMRPPRP